MSLRGYYAVNMKAPKSVQKALETDEQIMWIGKAHHLEVRLKAVALLFWTIILSFTVLFFKEMAIPFWQGESPLYEGKPVTSSLIWLFGLMLCFFYAFLLFAHRMQSKIRYIVTDRRAFIYIPTLGVSFYYDFKAKNWKRDYTDDSGEYPTGPIAKGGYFTPSTTIERIPTGKYGSIIINKLEKNKHVTQEAVSLKSRFSFLQDFPVQNSQVNLTFELIENSEAAELEIKSILLTHQSKLEQK